MSVNPDESWYPGRYRATEPRLALVSGGAAQWPWAPPAPDGLDATGLSRPLLNGLILRQLYVGGAQATGALVRQLGLPVPVIVPLLRSLRVAALLEASPRIDGQPERAADDGAAADRVWALSASGRRHAADSLARTRYIGRAPVPLEQYRRTMRLQCPEGSGFQPLHLAEALADTVLGAEQVERLARALGGRGVLYLHGPSGSGKSHVLARLQHALEGAVWVPHAIAVGDLIVEVFDPQWHQPVCDPTLSVRSADARWSLCRRPVIRVGALLSPAMLALRREAGSGRLHAPLQIKAAGGLLVADDFGRQPSIARALISRWLGPVECGSDWLSVPGGLSFEVPFACCLVVAASVPPGALGDEAFCRRIACRIELREPDEVRYREIVSRLCSDHGRRDAQQIAHWLTDRLRAEARPRWPGTAVSLVESLIDRASDRQAPRCIDVDTLDEAWDSQQALASGS
jgi:hypothetical protein